MSSYNNLYIKNKTAYIKFGQHGGNIPSNNEKYAVVMLCMLKDLYVVGACVAAFTHRYLIQTQNRNIKLIVMCDQYIYDKWHKLLYDFFDAIELIKLNTFGLSNKYNFPKKNMIGCSTHQTNGSV